MNSENILIRIVAVAFMLYAAATYLGVQRELTELQKEEQQLTLELEKLEEDNEALACAEETGRSDEEMERLARDRLGLVYPGDKIFYFISY